MEPGLLNCSKTNFAGLILSYKIKTFAIVLYNFKNMLIFLFLFLFLRNIKKTIISNSVNLTIGYLIHDQTLVNFRHFKSLWTP